jgi:hypothetical protein
MKGQTQVVDGRWYVVNMMILNVICCEYDDPEYINSQYS